MKTAKSKKKTARLNLLALSVLLPHRLPVLVFGLLLVAFVGSWIYTSSLSPVTSALSRLANSPAVARNHFELGLIYSQTQQLDLAKQELEIGQNLAQKQLTTEVLGTTANFTELKTQLESRPEENKRQQEFWQRITADFPAFRDAWVQLLYLSYNEGDLIKAKEYLEKVKALDPNYVNELPTQFKSLMD